MNSIWDTRTQSTKAIETELQSEASIIYQAFSLIDEIIVVFQTQDTAFSRVTGLTLLKGRHFAEGIYSLALDGLAQEAGALLRPLIECLELLTYFCNDPQRVNEALDEKLPSAGEIGKRIQGKYQRLRDYLNKHASHFSFASESLSHLVDFKTGDWRVNQLYNKNVLRTNMRTLFAVLLQLLFQSANYLASNDLLSISLEERLVAFKEKGHVVFGDILKEQLTR